MTIRQDVEVLRILENEMQECLIRYINLINMSPNRNQILKSLWEIKFQKRIWLINTENSLMDLWASIRKNEEVCDFILESSFKLMSRIVEQERKSVCTHLGNSFTTCSTIWAKNDNESCLNVVDEVLLKRLPTKRMFSSMLNSNTWFLTLIIMVNMDFNWEETFILLKEEER